MAEDLLVSPSGETLPWAHVREGLPGLAAGLVWLELSAGLDAVPGVLPVVEPGAA